MRNHSVALLIATLVLSACATPARVNVQDVSAQARAIPEQSDRWWRHFEDPLLDGLIADMLKQNLDLKVGLLRVKEARARRLSSEAVLLPRLDASLSSSRGNSQIGTVSAETLSRGLLEVSWEADLFGTNRATLQAEDALLAESVAQAFDVRRLVIAELVQAVLDYRYAGQQLERQRKLLLNQDGQIMLLEKRQKAGLVDAAALENAKAQKERTAASISSLESAAKAARFRTERLLGKSSPSLLAQFEQATPRNTRLPTPVDSLNVPLETLKNRPDVKAASLRLAASSALVKRAEADFWPKLRLSAFLGVQETSEGLNNFTASNPIWSVASSLTAPLLNRKQLQSNAGVAGSREEAAEALYQNAILLALQESQTFLSDYLAGYNATSRQAAAVERQKAAVDIANKRYAGGLTDYLPVMVAEEALLRATLDRIRSEQEAARAYVGLRRAMAG